MKRCKNGDRGYSSLKQGRNVHQIFMDWAADRSDIPHASRANVCDRRKTPRRNGQNRPNDLILWELYLCH